MPYQIPRNVKGEGRILYIFSTKALIYTGVGALLRAHYFMANWLDRIRLYKIHISGVIRTDWI